nr:immunoglobulin heavy chain junction region [Macaca mulatta]
CARGDVTIPTVDFFDYW